MSRAIKLWQAKRALLPLPHEDGFDLDEDERHLANIEALQAFVRVMERTQTDPIYHPQRRELEKLRAWALAEKSPSSPTYTSRRVYVQENRMRWQEIVGVIDTLLAGGAAQLHAWTRRRRAPRFSVGRTGPL